VEKSWALLLVLPLVACVSPDPKAELEVLGLETYWAVDTTRGQERYIAPVVRFEVRNKGAKPLTSIEVSAGFRRANDQGVFVEWGGDYLRIGTSRQPLEPGSKRLVVLKSDARYHSPGTPESMFAHELFRDPKVEVYLRLGSSAWVKFGEAGIERRVGSRSVPEDVRDTAPAPR
jgi:hypothetical protein